MIFNRKVSPGGSQLPPGEISEQLVIQNQIIAGTTSPHTSTLEHTEYFQGVLVINLLQHRIRQVYSVNHPAALKVVSA